MGWLLDLLKAPGLTMHTRLHRIRMAMPPAENPETFIVKDARPSTGTNVPPPKPVPLKRNS